MLIIYEFDPSGYTYEYNADIDDYVDSLTNEKLCKKAAILYDNYLTSEDLEDIKEKYEDLTLPQSLENNFDDSEVIDCAKYIFTLVSDENVYDIFSEDIKDYFEPYAKEAYEDREAYYDDPYGYNGVSQSDFI